MKLFSFGAVVLFALMVLGATNAQAQKVTKGPMRTVWPADQLKWEEVPNTGGVQRSILWGNPDKGASGVFYKFPATAHFPLHYHTSGFKIVVLAGTMVYTPEGGTENRLGPGSYLAYGPKDHHISGAADSTGCLFFAEQTGKFDLIPIEGPK